MERRISASRPITGSSLPSAACWVRLIVYFSRDCLCDSIFSLSTLWPPLSFSTALVITFLSAPEPIRIFATSSVELRAASKNNSVDM